MVQELPRIRPSGPFPETAPAAFPVFYRTYSRRGEVVEGQRESWEQVCDRTLAGLVELGHLTPAETDLLRRMQHQVKALPSGRWLWVGGTAWSKQPENFSGAYNCTSTNVVDWRAFGLMMDLAMMGCGTGAILEPKYINQIPTIRNRLVVTMAGDLGQTPAAARRQVTEVVIEGNRVEMRVGDSRQGWVQSYQTLLELSTDDRFTGEVQVVVDLRDVRPAGEKLKGFGGVANPVRLSFLYDRCATILNKALGRQLTSVECCLLIDEAAACVVAGNIRRCLPEDALVHTEAGLVPIAKVRVGDRVLTSKGFYPVTNFFVQGEQSLCRIRTQDGEFECTENHKVAVLTDVFGQYRMVKAKDLQPGDRLVFVPQVLAGTPTELPEFRGEVKGKTKPIEIPALTPPVAYFMGYLQGDGSVASDGWRVRFRVHEDSPEILKRLIEVGQEFGLDTHTLRTPEQCQTKAYELQFNSSSLNQYLKQFKQASQALSVPDCILMGTVEIRKAFLAGLADADGCHSQGVLVASIHKRFLQQVQVIYASLGITVRMCSSVRKRTNQWEGELVTVGKAAFEAVASAFEAYSVQFPISRREPPKRFNDHGFPKEMVRSLVSSTLYHWGAVHKQMNHQTLKKYVPDTTNLIPVKVKGVDRDIRIARTYDIEVATVHEFMCEGILVSNSAGMRQFDSQDELAASAKDNLWQQDAEGNWRIDPERDVLRMANHTRVFHEKPSLQDCVDAVRKQFYSGEGAMQWAGEAKRRAGGSDRYGLNPCVTADTWVHTGDGPRQVKDLIGQQHSTYINGELFSTTPEGFFYSGTKPVLKLTTQDGRTLRLTGNHQVLKVTAQTQKAQYTEWVAAATLQPGDRVMLHNHRGLQPWPGSGNQESGWLLGNLVGDGSLAKTQWRDSALLRFWGNSQDEMSQQAMALLEANVGYERRRASAHYHAQLKHRVITSTGLARLAAEFGILPGQKEITPLVEQGSYEFCRGFLQGLFDADGSVQGSQTTGISVRLAQSSLANLQTVQRMLGRLGILATIYRERRPEGYRLLPDANRQPSSYFCQAQHELVIAKDNLLLFESLVGFREPAKAAKLSTALTNYRRNPNRERFTAIVVDLEPDGVEPVYDCTVPGPARFDANGFVAHNCGEIIGSNFHCNLAEVHLNQIDPKDSQDQEDAFTAAALAVAVLLNHQFIEPRYQRSRLEDPIVGVSFTGLFDFFVNAFGVEWLRWWADGRPDTVAGLEFKAREQAYLSGWRATVQRVVADYCDRHGIKAPNRCTTVQPAGTKSLLTGASPGWHPPKAQRFIRRITFRKNDPVALACIDYGYTVVPAQSDKDEQGNLLKDPFDPRCTEWLVEIPVEVGWANLPGADQVAIEQFSAAAQFDFYMQVQRHYTTHNTSATIELREAEVESLAERIYQAIDQDQGYISAALLARFDDLQTFPRLPFEPIDRLTYEALRQQVEDRRRTHDFHAALARYDAGEILEAGPAGCDSDKCMLPEKKPT